MSLFDLPRSVERRQVELSTEGTVVEGDGYRDGSRHRVSTVGHHLDLDRLLTVEHGSL